MTDNMRDICSIKDELISMLRSSDLKAVDTQEAGEIVDMIKDLAETDYYCTVTEAMKRADQDEYDRYGYNPSRSSSTGRYMSRPGYRPMVDQEPYVREYLENPNTRVNWNAMGYTPSDTNRYGAHYDNYRMERRYYTQSHDDEAKKRMNEHANKHLIETIGTLREIWDDADPEMKRRMKNDLQNLMSEMNL